ncbi:hypothetical protein JCM5353_005073 [Sporobolomyces roseus]
MSSESPTTESLTFRITLSYEGRLKNFRYYKALNYPDICTVDFLQDVEIAYNLEPESLKAMTVVGECGETTLSYHDADELKAFWRWAKDIDPWRPIVVKRLHIDSNAYRWSEDAIVHYGLRYLTMNRDYRRYGGHQGEDHPAPQVQHKRCMYTLGAYPL